MEIGLMTMAEAAERLRLGKTMIQKLVLSGDLRSIKIGASRRIPFGAVSQFIERKAAESEGRYTQAEVTDVR